MKQLFHKLTLNEMLGPPKYTRDLYSGNDQAGVVTGLAWTAAGGEILFVETSLSKGTGKLTLTGNLGEVMKESAIIALEYLKSNAELLDLPDNFSEKWNIHIHVPEGAIPKDGPSAGVTMATSIASAFTQRKVKKYLAMTGEITLRGKVLPVGGIKEKILAAKRASIKEIIVSEENRKDVENIKEIYIRGLKFHYVETIMGVLELALLKQKVKNPKKISFRMKKIAVFPGSFDPFTIGHEAIVRRALRLFDEIIIAVGANALKKSYYSLATRKKMISKVFQNEPRVRVDHYEGLTVDYCKKNGARLSCQGTQNSC